MVADDFLVSLATIDVLESIGCEIVGSPSRLSTAIQIAKSVSLDAAVLDTTLAGEMVWPLALELLLGGVPFVFVAVMPYTIFPALLAHAPRLSKPLDQRRLLHYFSKMWGGDQSSKLAGTATPLHNHALSYG